LAVQKDWNLLQADVSSAFLQAKLDEDKYYYLPRGHSKFGSDFVWKSRKAIYGLREAPLAWNLELTKFLETLRFKQCAYDHSLFAGIVQVFPVVIVCYVDDLMFGSPEMKSLMFVKRCFTLEKFVGFQLEQFKTRGELQLSSVDYLEKMEKQL